MSEPFRISLFVCCFFSCVLSSGKEVKQNFVELASSNSDRTKRRELSYQASILTPWELQYKPFWGQTTWEIASEDGYCRKRVGGKREGSYNSMSVTMLHAGVPCSATSFAVRTPPLYTAAAQVALCCLIVIFFLFHLLCVAYFVFYPPADW